MFICDFGPKGSIIRDIRGSKKVGQYVIFNNTNGIVRDAQYSAYSIAQVIDSKYYWVKHRTKGCRQLTIQEEKDIVFKILQSEIWS